MKQIEPASPKSTPGKEIYKAGFLLIGAGILLLLEQYLKTHWLALSIPGLIGIALILYGAANRKRGIFIAGWIILSVGAAFLIGVKNFFSQDLAGQFGQAILAFAFIWLMMFLAYEFIFNKRLWWVFLVFGITCATGFTLSFTPIRLLDFVLSLSLGISLPLLLWGLNDRLLGLIIAGLIISTTGLGVYFGWSGEVSKTGLVETGTMLVWFSLGWMMITLVSRLLFNKFVWWPLIPGGIIAMVGLGLYIGGGQGNTSGFISNTGSIALILFGLYLILLKFGMRD